MSSPRITPTQLIEKMERSISEAVAAGVVWNRSDEVAYTGREIALAGERLLNFGGCSYLGLEQRRELRQGAIDALERYGTQFSFSRAYLECPLYEALESQLQRMTGGHPLVTASTSLGHISALPVLVQPGDAIMLDTAAHASLHMAASLVRGATLARVRHSHVDAVARSVARLAPEHARIWLLIDGVYSMHGDLAPLDELALLLDGHPELWLYVDDAHGMSWCGVNGRGFALSRLAKHERVVVALSLNKAFSAAGGAIVLPSEAQRTRVRMCGGPMVFSGPIQPPMLGAAVAAAGLHLEPGFEDLQVALMQRIDHVLALAETLGVPLTSRARTPIFFVPCGRAPRAIQLVQQLRRRGLYVSVSVFPAVPEQGAGIRFTVSLHNTLDDIAQLMRSLADELTRMH